MAYANGRLPASALGTIAGTTRRARTDVVPQINALRQAFQARFGKPLVITDGYRDYDEQVRLKKELGYLAGTPGTSNHGWGLALDLGSMVNRFGTAEYNWMKANAGRFGFYHPGWAEPNGSKPEPWHWETAGAVPVSNYTNIPGVDVSNPDVNTPEPIKKALEDYKMFRLIDTLGDVYLLVAGKASATHVGPAMDKLWTRMENQRPGTCPLVNNDDRLLKVEIDRMAAQLG